VNSLQGARGRKMPRCNWRRGEVLASPARRAGRTELLRTIFGLNPVAAATCASPASPAPLLPRGAWAQGVGMVSEDRKVEGLAALAQHCANMTLSNLANLGPRACHAGRQDTGHPPLGARLAIKCRGPRQAVGSLSGGNQQKSPSPPASPRRGLLLLDDRRAGSTSDPKRRFTS